MKIQCFKKCNYDCIHFGYFFCRRNAFPILASPSLVAKTHKHILSWFDSSVLRAWESAPMADQGWTGPTRADQVQPGRTMVSGPPYVGPGPIMPVRRVDKVFPCLWQCISVLQKSCISASSMAKWANCRQFFAKNYLKLAEGSQECPKVAKVVKRDQKSPQRSRSNLMNKKWPKVSKKWQECPKVGKSGSQSGQVGKNGQRWQIVAKSGLKVAQRVANSNRKQPKVPKVAKSCQKAKGGKDGQKWPEAAKSWQKWP